jgi:hypothetical protein
VTSTLGFPTSKAQNKGKELQHLGDQFLFLVIKVLGCLQKQVHGDYANNMWRMKGLGPPLSFLTTFLGQ